MTITSHPKEQIKSAVARAASVLFGVEWEPRVVRFARSENPSETLQVIDYAVPVFDLACKLSRSPLEVAQEVRSLLTATDFAELKVDVIGGYVNFQLDNELIVSCSDTVSEWLRQSSQIKDIISKNYSLLVLGIGALEEEEVKDARYAVSFLSDLIGMLGNGVNTTYVVGDYSEESIPNISQFVLSSKSGESKNTEAKLRRQVKKLFSNTASIVNSEELKSLHDLLEEGSANSNALEITNGLVYESSLAENVHAFLDNAELEISKTLHKDAMSRAVYFVDADDEENVISIRSASGVLYRSAYVLYFISDYVELLQQSDNSDVIVLAPQRHHKFIKSVATFLGIYELIHCFDPKVSRPDIASLGSMSLTELMQRKRTDLVGIKEEELNNVTYRRHIIELLDMPIDIVDCASKNQIPALFDILNTEDL